LSSCGEGVRWQMRAVVVILWSFCCVEMGWSLLASLSGNVTKRVREATETLSCSDDRSTRLQTVTPPDDDRSTIGSGAYPFDAYSNRSRAAHHTRRSDATTLPHRRLVDVGSVPESRVHGHRSHRCYAIVSTLCRARYTPYDIFVCAAFIGAIRCIVRSDRRAAPSTRPATTTPCLPATAAAIPPIDVLRCRRMHWIHSDRLDFARCQFQRRSSSPSSPPLLVVMSAIADQIEQCKKEIAEFKAQIEAHRGDPEVDQPRQYARANARRRQTNENATDEPPKRTDAPSERVLPQSNRSRRMHYFFDLRSLTHVPSAVFVFASSR
jgi:hypothetical protein